jgi:drug/metabolite transporter (DMT)-like permease
MAFAGAALLIAPRIGAISGGSALGYGAAAVCALTWSSYSVLSRRLGATPTDAVAGYCLVASALAALCHAALEETVWPAGAREWGATLALGLGPVGGAFYLWDAGVKRGDIQLLGVAAYAAPLLSTVALVAAGAAPVSPSLLAAAAMIAGGAALAAMGSRRRASDGLSDERPPVA